MYTYIPRDNFLRSITWGSEDEFGYKSLLDHDGHFPLQCIMTGIISKEDLKMSPVGDCELVGEPPQLCRSLADATARFSVIEPVDSIHSMFVEDFRKTVTTIQTVVDSMPEIGEVGRVAPFLRLSEKGQWTFLFEHKIFRKMVSLALSYLIHWSVFLTCTWRALFRTRFKVNLDSLLLSHMLTLFAADNAPLEAIAIRDFNVPEQYRPFLNELAETHYVRRVPVWDNSEEPVDTELQQSYLVDNLVQVCFCLKYNRGQGLKADLTWITIMN